MQREDKAPTQVPAERLIADGHVGMRVPRFAAGATAEHLNMVLWVWGNALPAKLVLIADEGRLHH